jgi:hypothetical protein
MARKCELGTYPRVRSVCGELIAVARAAEDVRTAGTTCGKSGARAQWKDDGRLVVAQRARVAIRSAPRAWRAPS